MSNWKYPKGLKLQLPIILISGIYHRHLTFYILSLFAILIRQSGDSVVRSKDYTHLHKKKLFYMNSFLIWWSWRDSNPRPEKVPESFLHV